MLVSRESSSDNCGVNRQFIWHRDGVLLACLAWVFLPALGCGGGGGQRKLRIVVRSGDVPVEVVANAKTLDVTVDGDVQGQGQGSTDAGAQVFHFPVAAREFEDHEMSIEYPPKKTTGSLQVKAQLLDATAKLLASGSGSVQVTASSLIVELIVSGVTPGNDAGATDASDDAGADAGVGEDAAEDAATPVPDAASGTDATVADVAVDRPADTSVDVASSDAGMDMSGNEAGACASAVCGGTVRDGCCPVGCSAATDSDCAGCGNGRVETGETCDPPGSCPVCDDQNDCTNDVVSGSATTCNLVCTHAAKTCSIAGKDRCCPMGCTASTDSDCAACGDGVVDPASGETCDPASSCVTAASCVPKACWDVTTFTGSAQTCNARCSATVKVCSGATADGCCPPGCNTSTTNRDVDCAPACGNGVTETGETCDPLTSCPTACPQVGCELRKLVSAATCQAVCQSAGQQTLCVNADGCCPSACNANTDSDCAPKCGNAVLEKGEVCDGNCPTACPQMGCQLRTLAGSASACSAQCVNGALQTVCVTGDGCCPNGCNANTDADCSVKCGNGILETGELCDGNCPTACPQMACQLRTLTGAASTCNAACVNGATQTVCVNGDSCCPKGCNANNDSDCKPACGNGAVEAGETCDPLTTCPTACPQVACQLRKLSNPGTCSAICDAAGTASCSLTASDGCCAGADANGAPCTYLNDVDCAVPNDTCKGAIDISKGGTFPVDLLGQTHVDWPSAGACVVDANAEKSPDVFFTFTLPKSERGEWVYLDVLDPNKLPRASVGLTIELYTGSCVDPTAASMVACAVPKNGSDRCGSDVAFPVLDPGANGVLGGKPLPAGDYTVVVHRNAAAAGRWALRFDHVPAVCAPTELVPNATVQAIGVTICDKDVDDVDPSCAPRGKESSGFDVSYLVVKCPNHLPSFTTCGGKTVVDTALSATMGSLAAGSTTGACSPIGDGKEIACHAGGDEISKAMCPKQPESAYLTDVGGTRSGLMVVSIDTQPVKTCGAVELDYTSK